MRPNWSFWDFEGFVGFGGGDECEEVVVKKMRGNVVISCLI